LAAAKILLKIGTENSRKQHQKCVVTLPVHDINCWDHAMPFSIRYRILQRRADNFAQ
jgi:hypothetical protein